MEAEGVGFATPFPIGTRGLQQRVGAGDVRLDERARPVDGTVDMGFCGQMHDRVGLVRLERCRHRVRVADISLYKGVIGAFGSFCHVIETGGIGQFVDVDDAVPALNRQTHHRRPDEPGPAGDDQFHDVPS